MAPKKKTEIQRELKQLRRELNEARQALQQQSEQKIDASDETETTDDEVVFATPDPLPRVSVQLPHQDTYTGSRPWESFIASFHNMATACRWNSRETRFRLLACLRGDAADFAYQQLPPDVVDDYEKLTTALEDRFGDRKKPASFVSQLETRRLSPNEKISEYAADIKRLTRFGYPTAD